MLNKLTVTKLIAYYKKNHVESYKNHDPVVSMKGQDPLRSM